MARKLLCQFLLLAYLTGLIQAVVFQRVCQNSNPYAPTVSDCQGFDSVIKKKFPNGTITQYNYNSECRSVFTNGTCQMDVCAFPAQGVNVSDFITTASDILNNCQTKTSAGKTGGYNIILNTNITVGVMGTSVPYATRCTTNSYSGATMADCQNAINNISPEINVTQSSSTGCSVAFNNGTCSLYYCDAQGTSMRGVEFAQYMNAIFNGCATNHSPRIGGWVQLDDNIRVGMYHQFTATPLPPLNIKPTCQTYSDVGGPSQSLLSAAVSAIQTKYGSTIIQSQANAECSKLYVHGDLQVNFCATNTGLTVNTTDVVSALKQLNQTCAQGMQNPTVGGWVVLNNTNAAVSVSASGIAKNIWCNGAPNNSPLSSDCSALLSSIKPTALYNVNNTAPGCTTLGTSGTCKVNLCGPGYTTISGQMLYDAMSNITSSCQSGNYVSGVYHLAANVSISVFDPPSGQGGVNFVDNTDTGGVGGGEKLKRQDTYDSAICNIEIQNLFGCTGEVNTGFGSNGAVSGTCYTFGSTNCFDSYQISGCGPGALGFGVCHKPNDSNFYFVYRNEQGPSTLTCQRGDGSGPAYFCDGNTAQIGRDICNESPCSCT